MVQIDLCTTCPDCGNGSLQKTDKYKRFGLKYDYTEYKCLVDNCGFITHGSKNLYFVYSSIEKERDKKLKQLGI